MPPRSAGASWLPLWVPVSLVSWVRPAVWPPAPINLIHTYQSWHIAFKTPLFLMRHGRMWFPPFQLVYHLSLLHCQPLSICQSVRVCDDTDRDWVRAFSDGIDLRECCRPLWMYWVYVGIIVVCNTHIHKFTHTHAGLTAVVANMHEKRMQSHMTGEQHKQSSDQWWGGWAFRPDLFLLLVGRRRTDRQRDGVETSR